MKLQVTQENLSKALASCARIASTRGTLPILANVLIKTVGNRLSIAATNLDIAVTHLIGSKVKEEGAITVPARLMQDFVSSLPSGVIDLELEDYKLHISTEKYRSTINGIPADDYPVMPAIADGQAWEVETTLLKNALSQVVFAASNDEARPVLTGVFVHSYNGKLYVVATDSYRLAERQVGNHKAETSLLIPAGAIQDLLRLITDSEKSVKVTHDDQQVLFEIGDIQLVTRLIDGSYPDYRKLIPKSFQHSAHIKKADLTNITKVSSLFARESAGSVTVGLDEEKQEVHINSVASQIGENTAEASAKVTSTGTITLNSRYILDALQAIEGETIELGFNGKLEPCVLKAAGNKDYTHIIMPLKS